MHYLEKRIPPLLLTALFALLMYLASLALPDLELTASWRIALALPPLLLGAGICLAGVLSFGQAHTTVNPLAPEQASALVISGIYRHTRNPMYLGFALALLGWSALLASPLLVLGVAGFVMYMNRFQIVQEEQALEALFGADYLAYRQRVRRWV